MKILLIFVYCVSTTIGIGQEVYDTGQALDPYKFSPIDVDGYETHTPRSLKEKYSVSPRNVDGSKVQIYVDTTNISSKVPHLELFFDEARFKQPICLSDLDELSPPNSVYGREIVALLGTISSQPIKISYPVKRQNGKVDWSETKDCQLALLPAQNANAFTYFK